jgi:hypothetical protein
MVLRLNFARTGLISRLQPLDVTVSLAKISCLKRRGGGVPRGDDDDEGWGDASARVKVANWCQPNQAGKRFLSFSSRRLSTHPSTPLPLSSWLKSRIFAEPML